MSNYESYRQEGESLLTPKVWGEISGRVYYPGSYFYNSGEERRNPIINETSLIAKTLSRKKIPTSEFIDYLGSRHWHKIARMNVENKWFFPISVFMGQYGGDEDKKMREVSQYANNITRAVYTINDYLEDLNTGQDQMSLPGVGIFTWTEQGWRLQFQVQTGVRETTGWSVWSASAPFPGIEWTSTEPIYENRDRSLTDEEVDSLRSLLLAEGKKEDIINRPYNRLKSDLIATVTSNPDDVVKKLELNGVHLKGPRLLEKPLPLKR